MNFFDLEVTVGVDGCIQLQDYRIKLGKHQLEGELLEVYNATTKKWVPTLCSTPIPMYSVGQFIFVKVNMVNSPDGFRNLLELEVGHTGEGHVEVIEITNSEDKDLPAWSSFLNDHKGKSKTIY